MFFDFALSLFKEFTTSCFLTVARQRVFIKKEKKNREMGAVIQNEDPSDALSMLTVTTIEVCYCENPIHYEIINMSEKKGNFLNSPGNKDKG